MMVDIPEPLQRVLLVEDDPGIRAVSTAALELIGGLTVCACASTEQALASMADFAPQLVVTDVMMAGLDGPGLIERLRQDPEHANIPVIFVTALVDGVAQARLRSVAPLGIISKPFDPLTLVARIRELWAARSLDQSALMSGGSGSAMVERKKR
jgi:two-component system, OmpR family, response regulator